MECAGDESPPRIANVRREFQLGLDLAEMLKDGFRYLDVPREEWLEARKTHWERSNLDKVRRAAQKDVLPDYCRPYIQAGDNEAAKWLHWLVSAAWRHPGMNEGLREGLAGVLPPAPLSAIPTPTGIYTPTREGIGDPRPFDPARHGHRACTASRPREDDPNSVFDRLVWEWCGQEGDLAAWLQRFIGAGMIGRAHRKVLNIIGPAGCGESTFTRCLATALGQLAMIANGRIFAPRGNHNEQIVELIERQPRFTFLTESQGIRIDADLLNAISGGEQMKERRPRGHDVSGTVTTLPVILGEAPFRLAGTTTGTFERVHTVPFQAPPESDPDLIERVGDPGSLECEAALGWLPAGGLVLARPGVRGPSPGHRGRQPRGAARIRRSRRLAVRTDRRRERQAVAR